MILSLKELIFSASENVTFCTKIGVCGVTQKNKVQNPIQWHLVFKVLQNNKNSSNYASLAQLYSKWRRSKVHQSSSFDRLGPFRSLIKIFNITDFEDKQGFRMLQQFKAKTELQSILMEILPVVIIPFVCHLSPTIDRTVNLHIPTLILGVIGENQKISTRLSEIVGGN